MAPLDVLMRPERPSHVPGMRRVIDVSITIYIYIYEAGTFTYHVMCCVAVYTKASQIISNFSTSLDLSCCLPRYVRSRYGASVSIFVDPA